MRVFVRPNFRKQHYGKLESMAAIEPPIYMLQSADRYAPFIDEEVGDVIPVNATEIVLCPHGNHPSAIFENIKACKKHPLLLQSKTKVTLMDKHSNVDAPVVYDSLKLWKYRPHNWHALTGASEGYGATYLSTSCRHVCKFCFVKDYYGKYWERDVDSAVLDIEYLYRKGVYNVKMLDEIFLSDTPRVNDFLDKIAVCGDRMNIWGYARIDTITEPIVKKARKAGVRWLAVGIESSQIGARVALGKGNFTNLDIMDAVQICEDNDVQVLANYVVGLPGDDADKTQEFAQDLNTAFMNVYTYVDYENDIKDPRAGERRKKFFKDYFTGDAYQAKIRHLFGEAGLRTIHTMLEAA